MLATLLTHLGAAAAGATLFGVYHVKALASMKADLAAINVKLQSLKL